MVFCIECVVKEIWIIGGPPYFSIVSESQFLNIFIIIVGSTIVLFVKE